MLDPTDFLALQAIRKSLNDLPVSLVLAINLGDPKAGSSGLTGHVHPSIVSSLVELSIVPGPIICTLPNTLKSIENLSVKTSFLNLRTIDLSYNQLTSLFPRRIVNRLNGPVDRLLTRLNRPNYLDLRMNQFTGRIPGSMLNFPTMDLQLQRNMFTGNLQPLSQISLLFSSVQKLYMNHNKFSGQVPGSLW
ncbi:hypothetical protein MKX01_042622 [Papaver californicum]|nr:hypothetical protein MKX01_042622 [Papaver californicum]